MCSKIVYADVSLKGMTLNEATQFKNEAVPTISALLGNLMLHDKLGRPISVTVQLDEFAYDSEIFRQAKASQKDAEYRIEIGVGLIAQLSVISKGIAADKYTLRGRTKSKLLDADVRRDGRTKAIGDFIFHYMLIFVVFHEVAHIALGHLDWLQANSQFNAIDEFGDHQATQSAFIHLQTLEGDADRQAAVWTAAAIDVSLSNNPYLRYQSLADAFYDIGYIYGALFVFLDSVDVKIPESRRKHPKADVRFGIALSFMDEYVRKFHQDISGVLMKQLYEGGMKSMSSIFHQEKRSFDLLGVVKFIAENGHRIDKMKVRALQHKVTNSKVGSFAII